MKFSFLHLFSVAALLLSTGCLVRETVTVGGNVKEENLKFKRPLKEAIDNTDH